MLISVGLDVYLLPRLTRQTCDSFLRLSMVNRISVSFADLMKCGWAARDIQRWEMIPLGPFLSKSFGKLDFNFHVFQAVVFA